MGEILAFAPTFSTLSISRSSVGIDYLGGRGICRGRVHVLYVPGSLLPSLAQLRAEKSDISGGSVRERILFLASLCRRG